MSSEEQVPIMTQSDSLLQFGNNAYGKPATALNILRETVMGRELFDHAFKMIFRFNLYFKTSSEKFHNFLNISAPSSG
jgi:hypothetical protein